ncbi:MAG TPA: hypothetical protein VL068_03960 [Microthrixaceae bacterium]|nr:hypothetical protein [Microthrixaceae bacterium]
MAIFLSESAEGSLGIPRGATRHIDHCLRCQAEQVQYRKVRRAMLHMTDTVIEPAPGLLAEIMAGVDSVSTADLVPITARQGSDLRRVAYVAAATAATAATAAGAIVLASRSKRPAS